MNDFEKEVMERINSSPSNKALCDSATAFMRASADAKYSYNFAWQGRPIIQYPQDMVAMQELIWEIKPDLIIETGIAHGGSLIFSASQLAQLDICDAIETGGMFDPKRSKRIHMIQGSSIDPEIINQVKLFAANYKRVMVCLDSNHTHDHVLAELNAYAHLTSVGSYCCVFDTLIEDMPLDMYPHRPWGPANNPKTAVWEYLTSNPGFEIDKSIQNKLLITVAPDGYLKRIK